MFRIWQSGFFPLCNQRPSIECHFLKDGKCGFIKSQSLFAKSLNLRVLFVNAYFGIKFEIEENKIFLNIQLLNQKQKQMGKMPSTRI
jgi:hypothetical protein